MKALIFDLGGVYFVNGSRVLAEYIEKKFGIAESEVLKIIQTSAPATDYRIGKIEKEEFWEKVLDLLGIDCDFKILEKIYLEGYELIEGTMEIVRKLKGKYKIAYLSDNVKERVDYLENKFDFKKNFDLGIFSHEVGTRKPNPDIFKMILDKLKMRPEETVFIDDHEICIEAARKLGMNTILFKSPKQLEKELENFGIKLD